MIYSKIYVINEWFTAAVCAGAVFLVGKIIISTNPANPENAAIEQPNVQQR